MIPGGGMGDMQALHLCIFLDDNEPPPGIIFRGQYVLQHRFLVRAYIDDLIWHTKKNRTL